MIKKILPMLLLAIIAVSLAGCGKNGIISSNKAVTNASPVSQPKEDSNSNAANDKENANDTKDTNVTNDTVNDLSNSMDDLDKTLKSIDDSNDVNSLLNN